MNGPLGCCQRCQWYIGHFYVYCESYLGMLDAKKSLSPFLGTNLNAFEMLPPTQDIYSRTPHEESG